MVAKCCIKGCKNEQYPGSKLTFHGFPSDEMLKTKWIEATGVTGNVKYKRICPLHFKYEDSMTKGRIIRLKPNVIPTFCKPPFRSYSDHDKNIFQSNHTDYQTDNHNYDMYSKNKDVHKNSDLYNDNSSDENSNNLCIDLTPEGVQEIKTGGIPRCKCCLESNRLKSMWQVHCTNGMREVYGIMLTDCFAIHWNRPKDPNESSDLICESCITRLRDSVSFKTEVLASEQLLSGQLEADSDRLKQEHDDVEVSVQTEYLSYEDVEHNEDGDDRCNQNDSTDMYECDDNEENNGDADDFAIKSEPHVTLNDMSIAYNKEEVPANKQILVALRKRKQSYRAVDALAGKMTVPAKRLKIARKAVSNAVKNKEDLMSPVCKVLNKVDMTHFENLPENLRKSIEAVQSKNMTEEMAATAYNVPREIISKEISTISQINGYKKYKDREGIKGTNKNGVAFVDIQKIMGKEKKDYEKLINEVKDELTIKKTGSKVKEKILRANNKTPSENRFAEMKKQANNIAIILESTNATPIRRHGGIGYGCCFCNEEFPDAADLKQHTTKEHDVKTKRNYAKGKRPSAYLVKLDITDLKCNLCGNTIETLEQLYDHLIEVHKKLLYRNAKNYIVPFKFDHEELRCLFCEFICNSFKGLLEHMSVHYRNHICEICDAGFLTKNNLFNHAGRHKKGTFKCDFCPKVFDTSSKKTGHQRLVHSSTNGVNRCGYCGEMFGTYRRKEKHLINEHGIILKKLKCKACDKTFETQTALRIHTKRDHLIERRFKCSVCDKRCFTNVQLTQHLLKHTGVKKFQCTICLKTYGRKSTLREHMRIHENDRRFKCDLCGMAFVQKCSWRGHMLSKHGQQV